MSLLCALCFAIVGCGGSSDSEATDTSEDDLIGGSETTAYPAIGILQLPDKPGWVDNCTGTLVASNVVLTAAHCVKYHSGGEGGWFFAYDGSRGHSFQVAESKAYASSGPGSNDLALVRLREHVPSSVARPAQLAHSRPNDGALVTDYGYGCTSLNNNSFGVKRRRSHRFGQPIAELCPGDSGGPQVDGLTGAIFEVNSGYTTNPRGDIYAHVYDHVGELERQIGAWR
jgi:secreted trypsin-like serine protease